MKRLQRVLIILVLAMGITLASARQVPTNQQRKPNIVFVMADDHAYQTISAYDTSLIYTPNIDRIAREGALMQNAFVTNSVCSPSRAVILTGKYSHLNGQRDNGTFFNGAQETMPKILQKHGYRTALVGKWHLFSTPTGFDYWNILPDQGHYYNPAFIKMGKDTTYTGYVTDVTTDLAIQWLEENKDNPFFIMVHHKAPHRNWMPPIKYLQTYNDRQFSLPPNFYDEYKGRTALQRQLISFKDGLDVRYDNKMPCDTCEVHEVNHWAPAEYQREIERLDPRERQMWDAAYGQEYSQFTKLKDHDQYLRWQFQRFMEDYLRCVKSVDDNVGRILSFLDENGLTKNTIVIYMSDQGVYLGEHGLYDKRFMYEEAFRTPMLIRFPQAIRQSKKIHEFVLNLDIAPTLLDLAGISIPADMQGESMKPLLKDENVRNWRQAVYYHYYEKSFGTTAHYGIRTGRYKLIHFYDPVDAWELYDLKKDQYEVNNLYHHAAYDKIVKTLKAKLKQLQDEYKDPIREKS